MRIITDPPRVSGEPTKADTARLVNYSENLVKALEDAGYVLSERTPIRESRYETNRSKNYPAYSEEISVKDLYRGVIRTPYLADDILGYAAGLNSGGLSGGYEFQISEGERRDIVESFEKHLADLKNNYVNPRDFSRLEERVKRLRDKIEGGEGEGPTAKGGHRDFLKEVTMAGSSLYQAFNENRDNLSNEGLNALSGVYDNIDTVNQSIYRGSPRAAMIGALGVSGLSKTGYLQSLINSGYSYPDSPPLRYKGEISAEGIMKDIGNLGIRLWNNLNREYETEDMGDKGLRTRVANEDQLIEEFENGSVVKSIFSAYPSIFTEHNLIETPWSREKGQYYKDLGEGFYSDREEDRIQNLDIPPSLFREGITPSSVKTYWNEDKKDFIEVYDYDNPDMITSRNEFENPDGGGSGGIPPSTPRINKTTVVRTPPPGARVVRTTPPPPPAPPPPPSYETDYPGFSFSPVFRGDIQQSAYRGRGTTDALTGASMDFMNPDGTMDRMTTDLSDVPDYITKDPYFENLLEVANEKYFNLERAQGAEGTQQAAKTPEAQMIARILSGDITIDEAKRQAGYTYASFSKGGKLKIKKRNDRKKIWRSY